MLSPGSAFSVPSPRATATACLTRTAYNDNTDNDNNDNNDNMMTCNVIIKKYSNHNNNSSNNE